MKKLLLIISIFLMFIISPKAKQDYNLYKESTYTLKYNNLNSKDLPLLLKDTNSIILEIETTIKGKNYKYRIYTVDIQETQEKLIKKITKNFKDKELITDIEINGVKVSSIKLILTNIDYQIIKERSKIYE